ncbi:MAG: site-2 protease family protein [Acidimicrobiales bacterium]
MRASLRLGTFAGIKVGIHWSIGLIAVLLTISLAGTILPATAAGYSSAVYLIAALTAAMLFMGSIVAHELGHSVVAERNDVRVRGITLFALGGVATLESEPESPGVAARIALAGPAVSLAIGAASLLAAAILGAFGLPAIVGAALLWLGIVNVALAIFNMLPALPLDGGRVLQAALWRRSGDQHKATISAATIGRYLGWGLVFFGLWQFTQGAAGLWTAMIGVFIIATARGEEFRARFLRRQEQQAQRIDQVDPSAIFRIFQQTPASNPGYQRGQVIEVTGREAGTQGVS